MTMSLSVLSQNPKSYIEKYKSVSIELMQKTHIPSSVILGISMLESGSGTSKLSKYGHNYFGIKGGKHYKKYNSDTASFNDFGKLITKKKFYSKISNSKDYNVWLLNMQRMGYSESPQWRSRIIYIIKKYNLTQYDII